MSPFVALALLVLCLPTPSAKNHAVKTSTLEDVLYTYTFNSIKKNSPTGVFTSSLGAIVIGGDDEGWVYRSSDYGKTFSQSKPLALDNAAGTHASIYGCAMSLSGQKVVIGTATHANFHSTDYGETFTKSDAGQPCSLVVGNADLTRIVCIGGKKGEKSYLMYGHAHAKKLTKSDAGNRAWVGLVSDSTLSHIVAVEAASSNYVYISKDKGMTWGNPVLAADDGNSGDWGVLCASGSAMTLMLTDTDSLNAHISIDGGLEWIQAFDAASNGVSKADGMSLNGCAISGSGEYFSLGFTGYYLQVASRCTKITRAGFEHCDNNWSSQTTLYSDADSYDTAFMAFSKLGDKFYSVDAAGSSIATGAL